MFVKEEFLLLKQQLKKLRLHMKEIWNVEESTKIMSSGQRKRHDGWNKSIMRDGLIVILRKDGSEKVRLDPKTKELIKGSK
jgi:hypothetical protein